MTLPSTIGVPGRGVSSRTGRQVVICQTAFGDYREAFLRIVSDRLGSGLSLYAGDEYFDPSTRTRIGPELPVRRLRNHFLIGRRLLWQSGAVEAAKSADVAVIEFNPRVLSAWATLLLRRAHRRPSLLWGHAWSRKGPGSRTEPARRWMRRLAAGVIVYTESQARELVARDPRTRTFVAPNALYRAAEMTPAISPELPTSFVYVGRLVAPKRPAALLDAFVRASAELPLETRLTFVGDGPLMIALREAADRCGLGNRIEFLGHVSDMTALRATYASAIASVSPGFVGLSITQSLGFGVPMLIARDEPHSPEIEAARDGWNALFYSPSTPGALARTLVTIANARNEWFARREEISRDCRQRYSAEAMADGFLTAVATVAPR